MHQHGLQSNLVVAASYAKDGDRLSKPRVLEALRVTMEAQPALRTVGVHTPSQRKGKTALSFAILHSVDLETCVEFREDVEPGYTSQIVEDLHNEWDFTQPNRPWFKLVVVGQKDVYLVYHHTIADGMSGYIFHRTFLDALNSQVEVPTRTPWISTVDPESVQVRPYLQVQTEKAKEMGKPWGSRFFETFWPVLVFAILGFFVPKCLMFADLPTPKRPVIKQPGKPVESARDRVQTRVIVDRIPKATVKKMLAKCRENGTTLTSLWQTASMIALTSDFWPDCWLAGNRIATDVRFRLPEVLLEEDRNAMCNRGGGITQMESASKYRKVVKKSLDKNGEEMEVLDVEEAWELARAYKKWIVESHDVNIRTMATVGPQGVDLDDYVKNVFPALGTMLRPTILLSNLGPLSANAEGDGASWRFVDAVFSAAPTHGELGSRPPIYSLAGVKGGDLMMVSGWQEGIASQALAEGMFKATMSRIEVMINA